MADYTADRRLFALMRRAGWRHEPASQGFSRVVRNGAVKRRLWVSWGQAEGALRLAENGEAVAGVAGQSESVAKIVAKAENAA